MNNIGEEIAGEYLKVVKGCHFIQYNLYNPDIQGEIDVIGVDINSNQVYICEVAIHLVTGLQYVKDNQPDNYNRFLNKFNKNVKYAEKYFTGYKKHFMLWSPIVKNQNKGCKHNQLRDVEEVVSAIRGKHGYEIELVINDRYQQCLDELRKYACKSTKELKSPVLRFMQIESLLEKHLAKFKSCLPS